MSDDHEKAPVRLARVEDDELAEIQKLALTGYDFHNVLHIVLNICSRDEARAFLSELVESGRLTFSNRPRGQDYAINIGFTCHGLQVLGLPERYAQELAQKAPSFHKGAVLRAAVCGDSGESAPERWEPSFRLESADVLISIYGKDSDAVTAAARELADMKSAREGLEGWDANRMSGAHLNDDPRNRTVFFGFRDGVVRPVVDCSLLKGGAPLHSAGELLLGYSNDVDFNHWGDPATPDDVAHFFRNGAFAVLRKMEQHERRFEGFLESKAKELLKTPSKDLPTDPGMLKQYLKAKLCGRWPNGVRVKPGQSTEPPAPTWEELEADREFNFVDDDRQAEGCPFGAHIRRGNPRGDRVLPLRRRPLFRRGVPYIDQHKEADGKVHEERGLLGVFFCSSIEDQFEHVLSEWVEKMPMGPPSRGDAKDPILGHHDDSSVEFHIPGSGAGIRLKGFNEPFVTTRGMLYALFPSQRALREIAKFVGP